jgi:hypothetical protein
MDVFLLAIDKKEKKKKEKTKGSSLWGN